MARRVLMVEDDATIAKMYRYRLDAAGWTVDVATSGEDALERLGTTAPDVVVLDIMLPGIDGLEVLRRLREEEATRGLRVLVLSNSAVLPEAAEEARRLGILDWMVKSRTSPSDLLRLLDSIVSEGGRL